VSEQAPCFFIALPSVIFPPQASNYR